MGKINRLDSSVYNRISAGEVVENPSSVVKELVENSIDAGATEITVSIESGGIKNITVTDNGCGMEKDDLELAVLPHATSKISSAEDLETVATLGFRGEALASICAVSKTVLRSRFDGEAEAAYISVEGGVITDRGQCNLQKGTVVEINSLFYNTPARFRFLKPPKGEANAVTKTVVGLILANPDVTINYIVDGETLFATEGDGLEGAVYHAFGGKMFDCMIPFHLTDKGYTISGYAARPASAGIKGTRNNEIFIVNGRCIEDASMQAVVANAYGDRLMRRTYPSIVVDIVMPFADVDVNVHPNKSEVRFADTKLLYGLVYNAVKDGLDADDEARRKEVLKAMTSELDERPFFAAQEPIESVEEDRQEFFKKRFKDYIVAEEEPTKELIDFYKKSNEELKKIDTPLPYPTEQDILEAKEREARQASLGYEDIEEGSLEDRPNNKGYLLFADSENKSDGLYDLRSYRVIGQLFETYVIVEVGDAMYIIDQHAAHERILFDRFSREVETKVFIQELVFPYDIVYKDDETIRFFTDHKNEFRKMGFDLRIKDDTVTVKSVPSVLLGLDIYKFFDSIEKDKELKEVTDVTLFREKLAQTACKSAIKGGDKLDKLQLDYFIGEYIKGNAPLQCPHGRPTVIVMTHREIEKMFGRIV